MLKLEEVLTLYTNSAAAVDPSHEKLQISLDGPGVLLIVCNQYFPETYIRMRPACIGSY